MKHFANGKKPRVRANSRGRIVQSLDESAEVNLAESKAYLECRSRGVEPPRPLAEAWTKLYDHYAPRIRLFLKSCGLPADDINDCSQDVWKEIVTALGRFHQEPSRARLSTWIMTLARNKAVDSIRRRNRRVLEPLDQNHWAEPLDPSPGPAAEYEHRRRLVEVRMLLAKLSSQVSPKSFQVLCLRWIEGQSTAEVAAALELTPEQVRFRAHRMKRKFRDLLEGSRDWDDLQINSGMRENDGISIFRATDHH